MAYDRKKIAAVMRYRSGLEKKLLEELRDLNVSHSYETLTLKYHIEHKYTPDIILENGVIIEAKGFFESKDRTKHLAIQKEHPELDIRFVFQRASNKLSKNSKTTYGDWADKHGFQWAEKTIPQEWIEEKKKKNVKK